VGYQTKWPSWFLHRMVWPRSPSACAQGAQKGLQATNRAPNDVEAKCLHQLRTNSKDRADLKSRVGHHQLTSRINWLSNKFRIKFPFSYVQCKVPHLCTPSKKNSRIKFPFL
jgi:hypothetical protein